MSEEFFWDDNYYSDDGDDDDGLLDDCFDEICEMWDISECDERKIVDFLRRNKYDVEICIAAGKRGVFGDFIPKYDDFEVSISRSGKARVNKVKMPGPNMQPQRKKVEQKPKEPTKKSFIEEPRLMRTLITGAERCGKTAIYNILKNTKDGKMSTRSHILSFTEGSELKDFFAVDTVFFVVDVSNSQLDTITKLIEMSIAEHCLTHLFIFNKFDLIEKQEQQSVFEHFRRSITDIYKRYELSLPIGFVPVSASARIGISGSDFPWYHLNPLSKIVDLIPHPKRDVKARLLFTGDRKMRVTEGSGSVHGIMRLGTIKVGDKVTVYPPKLPFIVEAITPQSKAVCAGSITTIELRYDGKDVDAVKDVLMDGVVIGERLSEGDEEYSGFRVGNLVDFDVIGGSEELHEGTEFRAKFATFERGGGIISVKHEMISPVECKRSSVKAFFNENIVIAPKMRGFTLHFKSFQVVCQCMDAVPMEQF